MAFSVQDFHDLVRLLEQRPDWRAELRRLILTEDLLALPAVVRELAEAQRRTEGRLGRLEEGQARLEAALASLAEAQRRTEERVGRLEEGQARLTAAIAGLAEAQRRTEQEVRALAEAQRRTEGRLDRLEQRVDRLLGSDLERRYRERAHGYFGRLLRRVRVVTPAELDELLEHGVTTGALDEDAAHDLRLADVIVRGQRPGEDRDTYLVMEVSAGMDPHDVERAARRAAALGRLRPALAVVAGERLTPEAAALAEARGVWRMLDGRAEAPAPSP